MTRSEADPAPEDPARADDASDWVVGEPPPAAEEEPAETLTGEWELADLEAAIAGEGDDGAADEPPAHTKRSTDTSEVEERPRRLRLRSRRRKREAVADDPPETPPAAEAEASEAGPPQLAVDHAGAGEGGPAWAASSEPDAAVGESIGELRDRIAGVEDSISIELSRSRELLDRELEPISAELASAEEAIEGLAALAPQLEELESGHRATQDRLEALERHLDELATLQRKAGELATQLAPSARERFERIEQRLGVLGSAQSATQKRVKAVEPALERIVDAHRTDQERLAGVEERLGKVEERLNQLASAERATQKRVKRLEPVLAGLRDSHREAQARETQLQARVAQVETTQRLNDELAHVFRPRHPRGAASLEDSDLMDLNRASFEDLRGAGLSVTQAVRVIARRDAGGFDSLDELDELQGFAPEQLEALKSQVRVQ